MRKVVFYNLKHKYLVFPSYVQFSYSMDGFCQNHLIYEKEFDDIMSIKSEEYKNVKAKTNSIR